MCAVVTHVQTRDEHAGGRRRGEERPAARHLRDVSPADPQLAQLVAAQRFRGTRVARIHVPRVLGEHHATVVEQRLATEQRTVEAREIGLHELRQVDVGGQAQRAVVGGFEPPGGSQPVDEQLLRTLRIHRAQADRQHEAVVLIGNLQGPQVVESAAGVALALRREIHFRDKEVHPLPQIAPHDLRRPCGNPVAVALQPRDQTVALLCRQNQDVVLADRVPGFDRHARIARLPGGNVAHRDRRLGDGAHLVHLQPRRAGILIEVLHQAWRGIRVQMVDEPTFCHVNLLARQQHRHRNHDREITHVALEVVRHGHDRAPALMGEHDLGRVIEQFGRRAGHIETAEGIRGLLDQQQHAEQQPRQWAAERGVVQCRATQCRVAK